MTYSVVWTALAVLELGRIERAAADPARVREAANGIDFTLCRTPYDVGESRENGFRLWYEDVLGVRYRIRDDEKRVEVAAVGPSRRPR